MTSVISIDKKRKITQLREKHEPLFIKECLNERAIFIPKLPYKVTPDSERIIALFFSEISCGRDVYIEFADTDNVPMDPERTLYKWPFNPEFETEYEKSEPMASGHVRYLIPVNELLKVADLHQKKQPEPEPSKKINNIQLKLKIEPVKEVIEDIPLVNILSELEDSPLSEMTMRDKLAIEWLEPISKKEWLNKVILEHNK